MNILFYRSLIALPPIMKGSSFASLSVFLPIPNKSRCLFLIRIRSSSLLELDELEEDELDPSLSELEEEVPLELEEDLSPLFFLTFVFFIGGLPFFAPPAAGACFLGGSFFFLEPSLELEEEDDELLALLFFFASFFFDPCEVSEELDLPPPNFFFPLF